MFCKLTGEATESVVFFGNLCYNLTKEGDDMRIEIRGDKLKVTDSIKSQIEEKLGKLDQYFNQPEEIKAYVVVRVKNNEQIIERFKVAYNEINEINNYNYVVVNDDLDEAVKKVEAILISEKLRVDRIEELNVENEEEIIHEFLIDKEFDNAKNYL